MSLRQFRALYRQFLFRIVDLEVLSPQAQGDANRLLGQFAALLVFISSFSALAAVLSVGRKPEASDGSPLALVSAMMIQHLLIATTMLVVGLFAVLSWDATFPDKRDVLVLAPLPVRARTMFLAKVAAVGSALGITILLLHGAMGLVWPVTFATQAVPTTLPSLRFDAAPGPVAVRDLPAVMNRDLQQALTSGGLAPGTGAGMVIGVWKHGEQRVLTYGTAKADSLFEIGSISKTFTGLILARMMAQGKVRLDEPVRELLPPGTVAKPASGEEITLLDLVTHHSGLPGMPDNFHPADRANPYADYGVRQLYAYLARRGVAKPDDAVYTYSNLGLGLLGQALAERAGMSYAELLQKQVNAPLGMSDTVISLSPDQQRRFLQGHDGKHHPVHAWDINGLAGAGAIRSTAGDMLTYLAANLHPEQYAQFGDALAASHRLRANASNGLQIALAWHYIAESGTYWHNGATAGFTSYAFFAPRTDTAAVVLLNNGPSLLVSPDIIGEHVRQRLSGEPAISLENVVVPASTGFKGLLRAYAAYWLTMVTAGVFVFAVVLGLQGLAAQVLPRRVFLRLSGYLQIAAFCAILCLYFLQPGFGGLDDLTVGSMWSVIHWLPSYWFLGLYQQLNGSLHPALEPLAQRAWIGLAVGLCTTTAAYALSYFRTLRKIVEEPDLLPGSPSSHWWSWWPRFARAEGQTAAIVQFSLRTLARSRQHRMILAFYLGIGLAFTILLVKDPATKQQFSDSSSTNPWSEASIPLWAASYILMVLAVVGTRVVFALPLDVRANWIFRVVGVRGGRQNLTASRRALVLLSVVPVWIAEALLCFGVWPSRQSAVHLAVLGLVGLIVAEICLLRFQKLPFACSYLPGKSRVHLVFMGAFGLLLGSIRSVFYERQALHGMGTSALLLAVLAGVWVALRWTNSSRQEQELRFEDEEPPALQGLGLTRDGVMIPVSDPAP